TRPQPTEDRHPVVTPHPNPERAHVPDERAHRFELLVASRTAQSERVHRRVVLDDIEGQSRLGDLVAVVRERSVVPGALARLLTPIGVGAWQDPDGAFDPD